jgi:hypothetical protein
MRIFGPNWKWREAEELHNFYSSLNIIRVTESMRMRCPRHVTGMGELRSACKILAQKREGKRPLRRPRRRWTLGK